jgi:hypothetical protein
MLYLTKEIAMGAHLEENLFGDDERKSCFNDKGITVVFKAIIGLRQDFVSLVISWGVYLRQIKMLA